MTHVRDGDGSGKNDVVLMFLTEKELLRAEERAKKNPEDLPKNYAIIQGGLLANKNPLGKTNCCKDSSTVLMIRMSLNQRSQVVSLAG